MRLFYTENVVTHSRAVIFINAGINRIDDVDEEQSIKDILNDIKKSLDEPESDNEILEHIHSNNFDIEEYKKQIYTLEIPDAE